MPDVGDEAQTITPLFTNRPARHGALPAFSRTPKRLSVTPRRASVVVRGWGYRDNDVDVDNNSHYNGGGLNGSTATEGQQGGAGEAGAVERMGDREVGLYKLNPVDR